MDEYTIIGWPDIQAFMDLDSFEDNATLINENDSMGIGSSTYLVSIDWLKFNNIRPSLRKTIGCDK